MKNTEQRVVLTAEGPSMNAAMALKVYSHAWKVEAMYKRMDSTRLTVILRFTSH